MPRLPTSEPLSRRESPLRPPVSTDEHERSIRDKHGGWLWWGDVPSDPPNPPADGSLWFWHNTTDLQLRMKKGDGTVEDIPGAGGSGGHTIEDEGTPLTARTNMNFVGAGVTAADSGGKTVVTIPGGVAAHTLLDASVHTDSALQAPTRGALVYANSTPKWDELPGGKANMFLRYDGSDPGWSGIKQDDVIGVGGLFLGWPKAESSIQILNDNKVACGPYKLMVDMTAKSVWLMTRVSSGTGTAKAMIYADNGSGDPGALVATSDEVSITETSLTWKEFVFSSPPSLTAQTQYHIAFHSGTGNPFVALSGSAATSFATTVGVERNQNADTYVGGAADPFGAITTTDARIMSAYIEGTSSAGSSGHTIRENGSDQTARTGLNFVDTDAGTGLITDDAGNNETEVNLNLYILKALLTTRGDIIYRNATVPARLAVGLDGRVLTSDGTDPVYETPFCEVELQNLTQGSDKAIIVFPKALGAIYTTAWIKFMADGAVDHAFAFYKNGSTLLTTVVVAGSGTVLFATAAIGSPPTWAAGDYLEIRHNANGVGGEGTHADEGSRILGGMY